MAQTLGETEPMTGATRREDADHRAAYTVAEVAFLLGLSRGNTYALIRRGRIPALKMGTRWIVPKRRFHAWLDAPPAIGHDRRPATAELHIEAAP
jgi:excisionase family DNA binding protein